MVVLGESSIVDGGRKLAIGDGLLTVGRLTLCAQKIQQAGREF